MKIQRSVDYMVYTIANQKGGVGKTTTAVNLAVGLAKRGKKVLCIDTDYQGSLSIFLGIGEPDDLDDYTLAEVMVRYINEEEYDIEDYIHHHEEGIDFIPANIQMAALQQNLSSVMEREKILKGIVEQIVGYDYIILDAPPSLDVMLLNNLAAADRVLVPVKAERLSTKGLQQLLRTIVKVRKKLNKKLQIAGILITMVKKNTRYNQDMIELLNETYGGELRVFESKIPNTVRISEAPEVSQSIFKYEHSCEAAVQYDKFVDEVMDNEQKAN